MSYPAVRVANLTKQYQIGALEQQQRSLREVISDSFSNPFRRLRTLRRGGESVSALNGVSFEVSPGEVVAIVGRNGAGKSTLLKILSEITRPSGGRVEIRGRVASLLEVGTGFHAELTGRENIYLNGAILGMKRREIQRKFEDIVEFSEVGKYIDTPVKRYSSGMYLRLAFAVAAHLEPEILVVDEVLAVGDASFQKKCLGQMESVARSGRTVLFVSHNMGAVQTLCPRAVLLRQGRVEMDGPSSDVVREYLAVLVDGAQSAFQDNPERSGSGVVRLAAARVLDSYGRETATLTAGQGAALEFTYRNVSAMRSAKVVVTIYNHLGIAVTNLDMALTNSEVTGLEAEGSFICRLPRIPFPLGQYRVAVSVVVGGKAADQIPNVLVFDVVDSVFHGTSRCPSITYCTSMVEHQWEHAAGREAGALVGGRSAH